MVYPHYFTGAKVPGFDTAASKFDFDDRYTLFFTPHSAHIDSALLQKAKSAIYWDPCTALGLPLETKEAAQRASGNRINGFVTSNEAFSYIAHRPEWGENRLRGRRLKPFGFDWITDGANPYEDPIVRVNRTAFRLFSTDPSASPAALDQALALELKSGLIPDIRTAHACCYEGKSWSSASAAFHPEIFREALENGRLNRQRLERIWSLLRELEPAVQRLDRAPGFANRHCSRVGRLILSTWDRSSRDLLASHIG